MKFTVVAGGGGHSSLALGIVESLQKLGMDFNVIHPGDPVSSELFSEFENYVFEKPARAMQPLSVSKYIRTFVKAFKNRRILGDVIISSGASLSFVVSVVARILGKRIWNFEVPDRIVVPSQTPSVLKHFSEYNFVSWKEQKEKYRKAVVLNGVILPKPLCRAAKGKYILVSTGTTTGGIDFLQRIIDACSEHRTIVIFRGKGQLRGAKVVDKYLSRREYERLISRAKLIITHPGYTAFEAALNYGKPVLLTTIPGYKKGPSQQDAKLLARKLGLTFSQTPTQWDVRVALRKRPKKKIANERFASFVKYYIRSKEARPHTI